MFTFLLVLLVGKSFRPLLAAVVHVVPQRQEDAPIGSQRDQDTCSNSHQPIREQCLRLRGQKDRTPGSEDPNQGRAWTSGMWTVSASSSTSPSISSTDRRMKLQEDRHAVDSSHSMSSPVLHLSPFSCPPPPVPLPLLSSLTCPPSAPSLVLPSPPTCPPSSPVLPSPVPPSPVPLTCVRLQDVPCPERTWRVQTWRSGAWSPAGGRVCPPVGSDQGPG